MPLARHSVISINSNVSLWFDQLILYWYELLIQKDGGIKYENI